MRSLIKIDKNEQEKCCAICIYSDEKKEEGKIYCTKKKKFMEPTKKCFRFQLDIMAKSVKRKHNIKKEINPDDYSIL